jgi:hypothetical protein
MGLLNNQSPKPPKGGFVAVRLNSHCNIESMGLLTSKIRAGTETFHTCKGFSSAGGKTPLKGWVIT